MAELWSWAVAAYRAPGVQDACLAAQDVGDQNVPLLLWAAWTAASGRRLAEDDMEAACDLARAWQETAIAPLRAVRRSLKIRHPDLDDAAREQVRDQVKQAELAAERALLEGLEAQTPPEAGSPLEVLPVLIAVSRAWSPRTPRALLTTLAQSLASASPHRTDFGPAEPGL